MYRKHSRQRPFVMAELGLTNDEILADLDAWTSHPAVDSPTKIGSQER